MPIEELVCYTIESSDMAGLGRGVTIGGLTQKLEFTVTRALVS